ncbi:hypothetical protein CDIK_2896 [Cucumispora dikerogammari]|nr:hypothetical protein CDIK_2896 [Cucumispora dikerogammari]
MTLFKYEETKEGNLTIKSNKKLPMLKREEKYYDSDSKILKYYDTIKYNIIFYKYKPNINLKLAIDFNRDFLADLINPTLHVIKYRKSPRYLKQCKKTNKDVSSNEDIDVVDEERIYEEIERMYNLSGKYFENIDGICEETDISNNWIMDCELELKNEECFFRAGAYATKKFVDGRTSLKIEGFIGGYIGPDDYFDGSYEFNASFYYDDLNIYRKRLQIEGKEIETSAFQLIVKIEIKEKNDKTTRTLEIKTKLFSLNYDRKKHILFFNENP